MTESLLQENISIKLWKNRSILLKLEYESDSKRLFIYLTGKYKTIFASKIKQSN